MNPALICDTSGLLAYFNAGDPHHRATVAAVEAHDGPLVLSPFVAAELDYLVATRMGLDAGLAVLAELAHGFEFPLVAPSDIVQMATVIRRFGDQAIGLADASLVVLAHQHSSHRILTLDHRHFGVLRALDGAPFELLP